ncbi:hypothetical protein ACET3Z_010549 [Daucus carota]
MFLISLAPVSSSLQFEFSNSTNAGDVISRLLALFLPSPISHNVHNHAKDMSGNEPTHRRPSSPSSTDTGNGSFQRRPSFSDHSQITATLHKTCLASYYIVIAIKLYCLQPRSWLWQICDRNGGCIWESIRKGNLSIWPQVLDQSQGFKKKSYHGLAIFGKTWSLKDPEVSGLGAPAMSIGPGAEGILTFSEIENHNLANKATVTYDAATVSTYSVAGSTWIGYDDIVSTTVKIGYAQSLKIGGYFFWALNGDHNWSISKTASQLWID